MTEQQAGPALWVPPAAGVETLDVAAATSERQTLMAAAGQPNHPLMHRVHPQHELAVNRLAALTARVNAPDLAAGSPELASRIKAALDPEGAMRERGATRPDPVAVQAGVARQQQRETARAQLKAMIADPDQAQAAVDRNHPRHAAVVAEMNRLNDAIAAAGGDVGPEAGERNEAGTPAGNYSVADLKLPTPGPGEGARDLKADAAEVERARGWAREAGVSPDEWRELVGAYNALAQHPDRLANPDGVIAAAAAEAERTLRAEWGAGYEGKLGAARRAVARMGPEFKAFLETTGLANSAPLIRRLAEAAARRGW